MIIIRLKHVQTFLKADNEPNSDSRNPCATGPWQESSPCDAECGKGMRHQQREYLNEYAAR